MNNISAEVQPRDEPTRIELQRLDQILSGGKRRFFVVNLALAFAPWLLPMIFARFRWFLFNNISYFLLAAAIVFPVIAWGMSHRWRQSVERAAAIRAGASFAMPPDLKDHNIFFLSAVFMGLFAGVLADETVLPPSEFTRVGRWFLFIAAVVFALWAMGKAAIGYRRCPPEHLRRRELLGGILGGILVLLLLGVGANFNSVLPAVVDFFVSRSAPNYLTPQKP